MAVLASSSSSFTGSCFFGLPNALPLLFSQYSPMLNATLAMRMLAATPHIRRQEEKISLAEQPQKHEFDFVTHKYSHTSSSVEHILCRTDLNPEE
jgi:hypothetical protein